MAVSRPSLPVEAAFARSMQRNAAVTTWLIGLSGGLDSTALLLAASRHRQSCASSPVFTAVHVNHGLHRAADGWEAHCVALCNKLHIECQVQRVVVESSGQGTEAAARAARYAVFVASLQADMGLLLGHHQDDQVETFFLRLMRGAGVHGLTGMPAERDIGSGVLVRPFLELSREQLRQYVLAAELDWVEDSSNSDIRFDRNYLRQNVLPLLAQRWPGYRAPVTRAMRNLAEQEAEWRHAREAALLPTRNNAFGDPGFDGATLQGLPPERAAILLRGWLREQGCQPPPRRLLLEFLRQLRASSPSSAPRLQRSQWCLQRHGDAVYLLPRPWQFSRPPPRSVAGGDSLFYAGVGHVHVLSPDAPGRQFTLRFRRGGEKLCLPGESHERSLKGLLQSAAVPPWWRERLPLLFEGDSLLAVGDLWQARDARAGLVWQRPSTTPF